MRARIVGLFCCEWFVPEKLAGAERSAGEDAAQILRRSVER
jgi:hypothetical protein